MEQIKALEDRIAKAIEMIKALMHTSKESWLK